MYKKSYRYIGKIFFLFNQKYIRQNSKKNFKYEQLNAIIENDNRILPRG